LAATCPGLFTGWAVSQCLKLQDFSYRPPQAGNHIYADLVKAIW
jgi:hypothetical protein